MKHEYFKIVFEEKQCFCINHWFLVLLQAFLSFSVLKLNKIASYVFLLLNKNFHNLKMFQKYYNGQFNFFLWKK